jgi:hypothetical protein
MIRYGKIYGSYWTSSDIAPLDLDVKTIGAYLLSSPHANMIGCYRLPVAYAVDDLRTSSETVSKGLRELSRVGFVTHDSTLSWVLIRRFLIWNPIENPNQGKAAAKLVEEVPKHSSVYAALIEVLRANPAHFPEGFVNGLKTVSQPFLNQYPYQEPYPYPYPEQKDTSASPQTGEPVESPPAEDPSRGKSEERDEKAAIGRLFHLYCEAVGRNPGRYTLTPVREKKALLRLRERRGVHNGDLGVAERDLAQAIENLAVSEWHRANGHYDWLEQIFRSAEEFERRLNWQKPTGEQSGNKYAESRNARICREALAKLDGDAADAAG